MRMEYLFCLTLLCSFTAFAINFTMVEAQNTDSHLDTNVTTNTTNPGLNVTNSIEFIGSNNVSNLAKQYDEFQKFK